MIPGKTWKYDNFAPRCEWWGVVHKRLHSAGANAPNGPILPSEIAILPPHSSFVARFMAPGLVAAECSRRSEIRGSRLLLWRLYWACVVGRLADHHDGGSQRRCEIAKLGVRRVPAAVLHAREVSPVPAGELGRLLLRQVGLFPEAPDGRAEGCEVGVRHQWVRARVQPQPYSTPVGLSHVLHDES